MEKTLKIRVGEDFFLHANIRRDGEPYEMKPAERIRVRIRRDSLYRREPVIVKENIGWPQVRLSKKETELLRPGKYRIDMELIHGNGEVSSLNEDDILEVEA